ncbi:MAG: GEVED domain-containing protein [Flavobacterium sp.]
MYKNYASMDVGRDARHGKEKITGLNSFLSASKSKWLMSLVLLCGVFFNGFKAEAQVSALLNSTYGYTFSNSTSVTYTSLGTSGTVFQTGSAISTDGVSSAITLPFVFTFNGVKGKTIYISNNGFITFGAVPSASQYSPISSTTSSGYDGVVSGFGVNAVASTASGASPEIRHGSNGGGDYVVQFQDLGQSAATTVRMTFQIILKADGKTIQIVYGPNNAGASGASQCQVGLRGTSDEDWNNRSLASGGNWNTSGGSSGSISQAMSCTATTTLPTANRTFQWVPTSYTPTYLANPVSVAQEFTSWVNGSGPSNVPSINWSTNGYGNASWQIDNTTASTTTSGWTELTGSYSPADYASSGTGHSARFHTYGADSPQVGYLDYYVDLSSNTGNANIDFYSINTSGTDILQVFLSTNGGSTFTQLGADIGVNTSWTAFSRSLGSTNSATTIIRFKATSDFGTTDIGLDHVIVSPPPVTPTITLSGNNIPAGNLPQNAASQPIYSFAISPTVANATLTGLKVTTTGTYASADITNLKCYYQSSSTFNSGTATLLSTLTTPGVAGQKTFPSFTSQAITNGATGYIFITADTPCTATLGNTIAVNAVTGSDTTFLLGTATGSLTNGGTQTVSNPILNNVTALAASSLPSSSSVSWTTPTGCYNDIMIVASTSPNTGVPTGTGSAYTASLTYGSGTALGNGFVIYKGGTSPQVVTGLTFGTTYYYKVFTRYGSVWSSGAEISQAASYCTPSGSSANTTYISNFTISNADTNINNNSTYATGGYINNSGTISASQSAGTPVNYSITFVGGTVGLGIWVDWNQNGVFTDAGENVYNSNGYTSAGQTNATGTFTVPMTATLGTTRMRVIADYNNTSPSPCVSSGSTRGEAEDYGFTVTASVTPTITFSDNTVAAANLVQNTTLRPIYSFAISPTVSSATLTGLKITTTGTYASADITNLKCYYQTSATFNSGTATLLSTLATPGVAGQKTFPSFTSQFIANGATGYIFITADVPCAATLGNTIAVNAVTGSDTTFLVGTGTGSLTNGTTQTVSTAVINNVTALAASVASSSSSVSWTAPTACYNDIMIVASTAANTGTPTGDGSAYTASLTYGSGSALGNGFVVYKGNTSPQVVTGLTTGTPYYYKVFTRFGSVWSSGVEISQTPVITYCSATGNLTCSSSDFIANVTINTLNNTTTCNTGGYTNFGATGTQTTTLTTNSSYTLSMTVGSGSGTHGAGVWIDFNNNGDFTDSGEFFLISNSIAASATVSTSITVPAGAYIGNVRMRVRYAYNVTVTSAMACTMSGTYGETEDYTLTIAAGAPVIVAQASANWSLGSTWVGGVAPTATDNAMIPNGFNVTTDSAAANVCKQLTIASGGTLTSNTSTLSVSGNLINNGTVAVGGGTINVAGASAGAGISNAGTMTLNSGTVNLSAAGTNDRTLNSSGTLTVASGNLNVFGNVVIANASNWTQSGGTISVDGNNGGSATNSVASGTPIFSIGTATVTYSTGTLNLTGGTLVIVDPHAASTATDSFTYYGTAAPANNITAGNNFNLQFGNGVSTDTSTNGFIYNQWETAGGFKSNVVLNAGSGATRILSSAYSPFVAKNLTVTSGDFRAPTNTVIEGNLTVNSPGIYTSGTTTQFATGTFTSSTVTSGANTVAQTVSGSGTFRNATSSPTANFSAVTLNNTSSTGVTLNGIDLSLSGVLTFTSGNIVTGSNKVILIAGASTSGAANNTGFIQGNEQMNFATGSNVARTFDIGTNRYTPATVTFASVTTAGNVIASTTGTEHPNLGTSGLRNDLSVNRYWTLTNSGVAYTTAAVGLQWRAADADSFTAANLKMGKFVSPSTWILPAVSGTPTATTITSTNSIAFASGLGDFVVAEACVAATPTGSLAIVNSSCASACTVSGGSIAIGTVATTGGTLEYSTDNGATWSATLPTYNAPQTILASAVSAGGCRSTSFQVGTTVAGTCTTPDAPIGTLAITNSTCASACTVSGGSIAIGTVSGTGGTLEYSTDNGATWSATLPAYNAPQTIIASVINAGGCRSTSTAVGSTVAGTCTTPAAPTGTLAITNSTCASACTVSGGSIAIGTVLGTGGTLEYSTDNGATWSATLPAYNAPQTIIASVINAGGCRSTSTAVGSTVAGTCTTPAAPTGTLAITNSTCASACTVSGGSIAIGTVSGTGGTLEYSTDNGATWSATLPAYNAPQTIIASVINAGGCRSTSTAVGSTVAGTCTTPATPTVTAGGPTTFCAGGSVVLTASVGNGYLWSNNATTSSITVSASGNYTVQVSNASGCFSLPSAPITVTATAQPLWYLDADGDHYYTGAGVPSCTSPGSGYTTTVAGGNDCDDNNAAINPGAAEICYNNIDDNCNGASSESCAPVVVNMTASYNGTTLTSFSTAVPAVGYTYPGATNLKYRFSVTNTTTGVTAPDVIQATRYVTIPLAIQAYNASYTIKASAVINEEVVPFAGNIITINAPTVQLVGLSSTSCGATLAALTTTIASNPGLNATGYTFRIRLNDSNPNPTYAYSQSSTRYVVANSFTGFPLQYSTSYKIAVQFTFNDPVTNQPVQSGYGAECVVNTPSIPVVGIASPSCGSQVAAMNTTMTATAASYATGYQFRIRLFGDNGSNPTYFTTAVLSSRFSALNAFQGITLAYSTEYSISVRYSILNGSTTVWSNYGPECKVTTPFFPTTSLVPSQCGLEAATPMNRQLNITPYPGFPHYMVKIDELGNSEDPVATQEKEISYSYFKLSDFSLVQPEKRYNISVAIKLNGVFGDYSTACDINTIYGNTEGGEIVKTNANIFKAVASPNPFANNFMISLATTGKASVNVKVYDMIGRMIEQKDVKVSDMESTTIGNNYPSGVYNVVVSQGDNIETVRVVKR